MVQKMTKIASPEHDPDRTEQNKGMAAKPPRTKAPQVVVAGL